jgi:hypothetical protein
MTQAAPGPRGNHLLRADRPRRMHRELNIRLLRAPRPEAALYHRPIRPGDVPDAERSEGTGSHAAVRDGVLKKLRLGLRYSVRYQQCGCLRFVEARLRADHHPTRLVGGQASRLPTRMRGFYQNGSCLARTSVLCYALMDSGGGAVQSLSSEEGYCQAIILPDPQ